MEPKLPDVKLVFELGLIAGKHGAERIVRYLEDAHQLNIWKVEDEGISVVHNIVAGRQNICAKSHPSLQK